MFNNLLYILYKLCICYTSINSITYKDWKWLNKRISIRLVIVITKLLCLFSIWNYSIFKGKKEIFVVSVFTLLWLQDIFFRYLVTV